MAQAAADRYRGGTLFVPSDLMPWRPLLRRGALVLALLALVIGMMWMEREGLKDQIDGDISFVDVIYFSMVTVTTVGYGDIVPVTARARLLDALIVTPIRLAVWFMFLGTAYQLIVRHYLEGYRMAKLQARLDQHIIVCGFGHTGMSTVKELLAKGEDPAQLLVIDPRDDRVHAAVRLEIAAFQGDATQEAVLRDAVIEKAKAVIVCAGRDDTSALILLTARHLNSNVRIIVSAKEEENVKLFRQGGANIIISPATFGGYILASAVYHGHLAHYLDDLLTAGGKVTLVERSVRPDEVGKPASALKPDVVLRIYRDGSFLSLWELDHRRPLEPGDILVLLKAAQPSSAST